MRRMIGRRPANQFLPSVSGQPAKSAAELSCESVAVIHCADPSSLSGIFTCDRNRHVSLVVAFLLQTSFQPSEESKFNIPEFRLQSCSGTICSADRFVSPSIPCGFIAASEDFPSAAGEAASLAIHRNARVYATKK